MKIPFLKQISRRAFFAGQVVPKGKHLNSTKRSRRQRFSEACKRQMAESFNSFWRARRRKLVP